MGQIIFTLDQTMAQANISGYMLSKLSGVRVNTIYDLQNGTTQRIHIEAIQAILDALNSHDPTGQYTINDIIQYQKNN